MRLRTFVDFSGQAPVLALYPASMESAPTDEGEGTFVTDTTEQVVSATSPARSHLTAMNVAELKALASGLGITGTAKLRKEQLVTSILARQSGQAPPASGNRAAAAEAAPRGSTAGPAVGGNGSTPAAAGDDFSSVQHSDNGGNGLASAPEASAAAAGPANGGSAPSSDNHSAAPADTNGSGASAPADQGSASSGQGAAAPEVRGAGTSGPDETAAGASDERGGERQRPERRQSDARRDEPRSGGQRQGEPSDRADQSGSRENRQGGQGQRSGGGQGQNTRFDGDDGASSGRRRNRQRSRDRKRGRGQGGGNAGGQDYTEPDAPLTDEDVLVPVAGILDVLDNYAFVRTSGYLSGPNDVYVPLGMVRRHGLRKGDAVTGAVRAPREGEQQGGQGNRQKFNALVRVDTVNGMGPDQARSRVEFTRLTPLYPQERLRLESPDNNLTTRVIDLVAPIGKGQRGLIVSPPKAGKTMIMQAIANAITTNNPECHLMIVLVDERPEEVTDFQRTVKGEVIASTFDRPAVDHTTVAELAIERAKRLVELGQDVVVLLDGITRLGRAYNLAAPASGRILSGGVDSSALYPPKRFFGAARNIEDGGSLTILATALVETGSKMDEVIFEEFKGTGNMELRLSRQLADRRTFPAVDVNASGTRREEILMSNEELRIMWKLRRVLSALDTQQSLELLIERLKKTKSNFEFLRQVQMTSSIRLDDEKD